LFGSPKFVLCVKSGKHVLSRVLSATNEEGRIKGGNSIKLVTDEIKQLNQSSYLEKADITGDSVNGEDAIDVDDNDVKLTKSSNASGQVSETIVSDIFAS
jgi:alpha-1,4-galacturonosyltransferase